MHLSTEHPANAQPLFSTEPSYFMYGPAGQEGALEMGPDGRGRVHDEVYGFWVDQGHGVVVSSWAVVTSKLTAGLVVLDVRFRCQPEC